MDEVSIDKALKVTYFRYIGLKGGFKEALV